MRGTTLLTALAVFMMCGLCPAQTQREKPKPAAEQPSQLPKKSDPSATASPENAVGKAAGKIGEALENTGQAVRESLGLAKTGCLTQGDEADPFILTDDESGDRITLVGSADLPKHVDHKVTVRGSKEAEGRVFHVTGIEHVSASCEDSVGDSSREDHGSEPRDETPAKDIREGGVTADDQGLSAADRQTTQSIRKAITADETLSVYAKNVKVITRNGIVTLRGPVRTEEEKRSIETKAAVIAGAGNVRNQLTLESAAPGR